jgi:hypothetical protein
MHPKEYPKGVTGASSPAIPQVSPPPDGLFYGVLRLLPRNEIRLGGFVRDTGMQCGGALGLALASSRL